MSKLRTYNLEGDGHLVFQYYDIVSASLHTTYYPNLDAVAASLSPRSPSSAQDWINYGKPCVKTGLDYFISKFQNELSDCVKAFKAARFSKRAEMQPTATEVDSLKIFPFFTNTTLHNFKTELCVYMAKAASVIPEVTTLFWWQNHSNELPHWSAAVQDVVLVQPSFAAAERVFSFLLGSFDPQQDNALNDYIQASLMLQYNSRSYTFVQC